MIEALMRIDLIKYQALGNDYLVFDLPGDLDGLVSLLPVLCDRNRGLGSDGLLAFDPQKMSVRIFNPDGSEAQKSGNGLRIMAAHAGPPPRRVFRRAGDQRTMPRARSIPRAPQGLPGANQRPALRGDRSRAR